MVTQKITNKVYLFITILLTILFVYITWNHISMTQKAVIEEKESNLIEIITRLQNKLTTTYGDVLKQSGQTNLTDSEKREILNSYLQPILESYADDWPGYGMGFYSKELNIVALLPFNKELLGRQAAAESMKVYEKKDLNVNLIKNGFTWGGSSVLSVNDPIFVNEEIIGHVWANIKTDKIEEEVFAGIYRNIIAYILIWLVMMFIIRLAINKIEKSIAHLIDQINTNTEDLSKFAEVPQLIPLANTVKNLRTHLEEEHRERQKMLVEITRLDRLNILGEMAATVAHEIRNPMTVVMGYCQLISARNKENTSEFKIIIDEIKHVNKIVEDFLNLARTKEVPKSASQLNEIIESVYPLIYAESVYRGVEIHMELEPNLPKVIADEKEIKQLILNLARNSIEVMDSTGILTIQTLHSLNEDFATIIVSDTGCGISEDDLKEIFAPFFTTKEYGTGLGLCVCKNIIEKHGGRIEVKTKLNEGTAIIVHIPIVH